MQTTHEVIIGDARNLTALKDNSMQLAVTSPPYPMIAMWDAVFSRLSSSVADALADQDGDLAFAFMHRELDKVWAEVYRVLADGCFACVNIGDATRSIGGNFQLYANHARVTMACKRLGFTVLPIILWKKPTNSPNKFMGSGMLPAGAYVTLEHEYILLFRKGGKRIFATDAAKQARRASACFWEERNTWFADTWELPGVPQKMQAYESRQRSAAFPFELAWRLINMYSLRGDNVVDPFAGTGTTAIAALAAGRNSCGVDIDPELSPLMAKNLMAAQGTANQTIHERVEKHQRFIAGYRQSRGEPKHRSRVYGFPVITRQEGDIEFMWVRSIEPDSDMRCIVADYQPLSSNAEASHNFAAIFPGI